MARSNIASLLLDRQTEKIIERRVQMFCNGHSLLFFKFVSPAHKGVPDRIICGRGKVLFIEFKSPRCYPNKKQVYEIERLREAGMTAYWSSSYNDILALINSYFDLKDKTVEEPQAAGELPKDALDRLNALYHNPGATS